MSEIYSTGKVCPYNKQNCDLQKEGLSLEPGKPGVKDTEIKFSLNHSFYQLFLLKFNNNILK